MFVLCLSVLFDMRFAWEEEHFQGQELTIVVWWISSRPNSFACDSRISTCSLQWKFLQTRRGPEAYSDEFQEKLSVALTP